MPKATPAQLEEVEVHEAYGAPNVKTERVPTAEELRHLLTQKNATPKVRAATVLIAHAGVRPQVIGDSKGQDGLTLADLPELVVKGHGKRARVEFPSGPTLVVVRASLGNT